MGEKYANYTSLSGKAAVDGYKPHIDRPERYIEKPLARNSTLHMRRRFIFKSPDRYKAFGIFCSGSFRARGEELRDWLQPNR